MGDADQLDDEEAYRTALQQWVGETRQQEQEEQEESVQEVERLQRVSNMAWLAALDHALQAGVGQKLSDFLPLRRVVPLTAEQRRFFVQESDLSPHGCPGVRRACIHDSKVDQKFVEAPVKRDAKFEVCAPPHLILCLDQGSVGWPAAQFLFQKLGLQGWCNHDPFHRLWNDIRLSLTSSGLWSVVREMTLVFNHRSWAVGRSGLPPASSCSSAGTQGVRRLLEHILRLLVPADLQRVRDHGRSWLRLSGAHAAYVGEDA